MYVIAKNNSKESLSLNFTQVASANVWVHRGGLNFNDTFTSSQQINGSSANLDFPQFGDNERIYIIARAKIDGSQVSYQTFSY